LEIRRLETTGGTWMPNIFPYFTDASNPVGQFADDTPKGQEYSGWRPADDVINDSLTTLEKGWMAMVDKYGPQTSPNAFWAVSRAIKNAGLENATLAVDDLRLIEWLNGCELDRLSLVYRPDLFNEIRLVKTADELEIMSHAAMINENAVLKAATNMQEGFTWAEVESIYMTDIASNGGTGVYLMCGVGELPAGKVRKGEPILLDGLGKYQHYHGDFGRCVVVGEPSEKHKRYHQALCAGWETAQELIKPGISAESLSKKVARTVRQAGIRDFRDPIVHSVGLEHTDDPKPFGVMPQTKEDQVLKENMVINVDLPHTEIGWGSVHLEDTVVVTANGYRRLSRSSVDLIVSG